MGARHVGTQVMTLIAACKDAILFVETLLDKGQMSGVGGLILLPGFVALCGAILFSFSLWVSWRKCRRGYAGIQRSSLFRKETEHLFQGKPFAEETMNHIRNGTFCHRGLERYIHPRGTVYPSLTERNCM